MSCPFVQPDIVRLTLSTGDYLDVKRELNAGEHRKVWADMRSVGIVPGEITLNLEKVGLTRILAYLIGWSFVDADGRPVPVSEAALNQLQNDMMREVSAVIDQHETAQDQLRADRKKTLNTSPRLQAIS